MGEQGNSAENHGRRSDPRPLPEVTVYEYVAAQAYKHRRIELAAIPNRTLAMMARG